MVRVMLCAATLCHAAFGAEPPRVIAHVTVYSKPGRYGGWPANHGIWSWGNEIVVGFSAAYYQWMGPDRHPYDRSKPEEPYLGRSVDGGGTRGTSRPRRSWFRRKGCKPHPDRE